MNTNDRNGRMLVLGVLRGLVTAVRTVNIVQITQNFEWTVLREFWELGELVVCGCEKELEVYNTFSPDAQIATSWRHFFPFLQCNLL